MFRILNPDHENQVPLYWKVGVKVNDRFIYFDIDTDSGADIGENGEVQNDVSDVPENIDSGTSDINSVSDTLGSDYVDNTTPEDIQEDIESNEVDNTSDSMEYETSYSESGAVDYIPELEYIDYLLNEQLNEMKSVQTVSGNSVLVTFDDSSMQMLTEIRDNQVTQIENQNVMINLIGCLLFSVVAEYLILSSKRVMKKMVNRRE